MLLGPITDADVSEWPVPASQDPLQAEDIVDAIAYVVTRPRYVAVNEMLVRPTEQDRYYIASAKISFTH